MERKDYSIKYNLASIIVRPLYFGLGVNIVIPGVLLFVCYYLNNNYSFYNRLGELGNVLFYVFGALTVAQAGLSLWWRNKLYNRPMIRRKETFEEDLKDQILKRSKPVFILIATICIYGYLYFLLTGRFTESVFFVIFSFLVFQVVRPRYGMIRRLIAFQEKLVEQGQFLKE